MTLSWVVADPALKADVRDVPHVQHTAIRVVMRQSPLFCAPSSLMSARSFWTYEGSPPRNVPAFGDDSAVLKTLSLPLSPFHVLNCGYCLSR